MAFEHPLVGFFSSNLHTHPDSDTLIHLALNFAQAFVCGLRIFDKNWQIIHKRLCKVQRQVDFKIDIPGAAFCTGVCV